MYETIKKTPAKQFHEYVKDAGDGLYLEFGVHTGSTITAIADNTPNKVYGFDSFEGLPESWHDYQKGHFACEMPKVPENVILIKGLFQDTLPKFMEEHKDEKIAFVHIDCDLYSSTKCVFDNIKDNFIDGAIICFDELVDYGLDEYWKDHEWKAWNEFLEETNYKWECLGKYGGNQVAFKIYK